jgi:hypothetical protein
MERGVTSTYLTVVDEMIAILRMPGSSIVMGETQA